jgi:glycosyltransferase involved in cell wall biosynthesis
MAKKNLLELCLSPDLGGLELYMMRAAKALDDEFNLISVINEDSKLEQYYKDTKFKYKQIKRKRSFSFSAMKSLAKIIDENSIDIIHLHWTKDIPIAVMAKKLSKTKPRLVQTRNMNMTRFKDDFYHRFLYKNIDKMLAVSYKVKDQIQKFIPKEIRPDVEVLYMGSDKTQLLDELESKKYKKELGVSENQFLVGLVGRIEKPKGQYLLIESAKKLKAKGIDIKVFFVGHAMKESYLDELKQMVKEYQLEDNIVFYGFTKNPHHFMQVSDAIVLATPCETFGLVVIEAMQVGTVAIATNQCGPLEMIEDSVSGFLFESENSEDLADKIEMIYLDSKLKDRIAKAGQAVALDKFSNEKQFKKLSNILQKMSR